MDSDWREVNHFQLPQSTFDTYGSAPDNGTIVGALAFDTQQELLWVGDHHGEVKSYFSARLEIVTSFKAHPPNEGAVKQFLFDEKRIFSLAPRSLHCEPRQGLTKWHTTHLAMRDMACMTFLDKGSSILVAGSQEVMLKISVTNGEIIQQIPTTSKYMMIRKWRSYICAATDTGSVDILDPETLAVRKQWKAHSSRIADMDAKHDFLITCGWTMRSHGAPAPEPIAKVFNLKTMEQFKPISFPAGASFVRIHPKQETTCVVGSRSGQLQVIDITDPDAPANINYMLAHIDSLTISPSGNFWIMVDEQNSLHVWGPSDKLTFNDFPEPTDFPPETEDLPYMPFDTDEPFSTVGLPYYKEKLLSAWGGDDVFEVGHPPPELDVGLNLRTTKLGIMADNPVGRHRNQVQRQAKVETNGKSNGQHEATETDPVSAYANVRIKYGQHGISGFDFQQYNKTEFSGLESDIQHSYLNPLLQLLKYTPSIRNTAMAHVASNCLDPNCLLCELGFLFDNLEKAKGTNCQATNFLNAFHSLNLAKDSGGKNLDDRTVQATKALLSRLVQESQRIGSQNISPLPLDQVLMINAWVRFYCTRCGHQTDPRQDSPSILLNLVLGDQATSGRRPLQIPKFSEILTQSLVRTSNNKGWCNRCKAYPSLRQRRLYPELPPVLTINACPERDQHSWNARWGTQGWLPDSIGLIFNSNTGELRCTDDLDQPLTPDEKKDPYTVIYCYDLVGVVAQIYSAKDCRSHLVSLINVSISGADSGSYGWHLFNDFAVQKVTKENALRFDSSWKTPVIMMFQVRSRRELDSEGKLVDFRKSDDSWKTSLDTSCLYDIGSLASENGSPLHAAEVDSLNHVAIDAEFVKLENERYEITIDGKKKTTKPKRQAIGRVSALREKDAEPFIDDYIAVFEPIIDYQTQYSGLEPGDLDVRNSPYNLQPLKIVYRKLWLLLNLRHENKIMFVGHGLASDFRVLNLFVPKEQIIDTVEIFKEPDGRFLSLRYLAWFFLRGEHQHVQTGNHDSIVDARTALKLWLKSEELKNKNTFTDELHEAYNRGLSTKFLPQEEFNALQLQQRQARARGGGLELPSGRMTPDNGGSSAAGSAPVTPEPKGRGRGRGEGSGYFASPLR